jgi:hypothetical protein
MAAWLVRSVSVNFHSHSIGSEISKRDALQFIVVLPNNCHRIKMTITDNGVLACTVEKHGEELSNLSYLRNS